MSSGSALNPKPLSHISCQGAHLMSNCLHYLLGCSCSLRSHVSYCLLGTPISTSVDRERAHLNRNSLHYQLGAHISHRKMGTTYEKHNRIDVCKTAIYARSASQSLLVLGRPTSWDAPHKPARVETSYELGSTP